MMGMVRVTDAEDAQRDIFARLVNFRMLARLFLRQPTVAVLSNVSQGPKFVSDRFSKPSRERQAFEFKGVDKTKF